MIVIFRLELPLTYIDEMINKCDKQDENTWTSGTIDHRLSFFNKSRLLLAVFR